MDRELLDLVQASFPVVQRPFLELAKKLGLSEEEVIELYKKLKNEGIIRQTSAIFDTKSLGYDSSLVAFKAKDIEKAAEVVNAHPGVSHNYERDHDFNLWFTIAVPPGSKLGLQKTVEILAQESGVKEYILLPTKKMFKIKVHLDTTGKRAKKEHVEHRKKIKMPLEPYHFKLISMLQEDIKPVKEPFKAIVESFKTDYQWLEQEVQKLQDAGYMRRFATILRHRKAGFNANAMVVWDVDESKASEIGQKVAQFSAVSHCYLRPTYPNWPYSLFSMIHGKSKEEVEEVVQEIAKEIEPKEYRYLYSMREFKKERIKYFSPEFHAWEERYAG